MQFLSTYFTISIVRDPPPSPIETPDWTLAPKRSSYHEQPLDSQFLARFVWHIVVFLQPDETAGSTQNTFNRASINLTPGRQRSEKSPCVGKIYVIFDSTSNVVKKNFSWNFFIWRKLVDQNSVHAEKKHKSRIFNKIQYPVVSYISEAQKNISFSLNFASRPRKCINQINNPI